MTDEYREREVIVDRGDGTGVGTIVGIILAIVVVLAIVWFFAMGGFGDTQPQQNIEIQPPAVEQPMPEPAPEQPAP